ncbi:uncharacterized protein PHACADRAFT_28276 [Phanerochaete carnosa HHB-10118-sp]|uniref:Transmembrane protein n=1 Tax=Phanerochaete carnosa (strain HHB-10118-sp) TaxID=650164 RepID=K5W8B9_PHACS|nr:uncharacterized protein PHACADRAFT_28276 [Phanerochaete carnosa HHB-10118-sp]EKM55224.1 hypothetical protein PHACADRAFT_28276 [Phanerochaete carnosa HHB-10118-sp]
MPMVYDLESNTRETRAKEQMPEPTSTPKLKHVAHNTNYSQKSEDKKEEEKKTKEKVAKEKSTKKKSAPKTTSSNTSHDVDDNAVPNPVPDTGATQTSFTVYHTGGIYSGVLPVIQPSTTQAASTSGFSPLPPFAAYATSLSSFSVLAASTSTVSASPSVPAALEKDQQVNSPQPSKGLPVAAIAVLAFIGLLVLVGLAAVIRSIFRKPKRSIPTPSRPILQDPFQDDPKKDPDEESLFGGKERSSQAANEVLLDWRQYPHTSVSVTKPLPTFDVHAPQPGSPSKRASVGMAQNAASPLSGLGLTPATNNLGARSPSRLSLVSASIYPGSPVSTNQGHGVGIAVSGSPLTADNLPLLQRSKSNPSTRRASQAGGRARHSMLPSTYGTADLYGGPASPLPTTPKVTAATNTAAGRARVKAPYAPGSLLRTSATAPVPNNSLTRDPNPFEEPSYVLPPISPVMKSNDRRERDTKALTSALGLASPAPAPPSPNTTLYPDDSITLAGDRRRRRSEVMSPPLDATARLGKLLLGEFQSTNSVASVRPTPPANSAPANGAQRTRQPVTRKRVEEKPPRVPSPPPMPSLAQMALQHSNPQYFEDYRSPTYSIYGLYDPDRKSRTPGEGGY